jgi:hypothetical protein
MKTSNLLTTFGKRWHFRHRHCAGLNLALSLFVLLPQQAWAGWFENARAYFLAKHPG